MCERAMKKAAFCHALKLPHRPQERLKSMSRKGVKEVEVTSADVGIVEGRLNGILNSLHKLRGTLQERDDTRRQKAEQAELTRQWEEMQKTQRQAER